MNPAFPDTAGHCVSSHKVATRSQVRRRHLSSGTGTAIRSRRQVFDKDILKVGRWRVGGRPWDVTPGTLQRLVANWRLAEARGIRIPVVWNHSHDARDQIGEILALYIDGDSLRARFWAADPADIKKLGVTVHHVSVEVHQPWQDGLGHVYDLMLVHLGVVNLPVISAQGPFQTVRLLRLGERTMPLEPSLSGENATTSGGDPNDVVALFNGILNRLGTGYALPAETTFENLSARLSELLEELASNGPAATQEGLLQLRLDYEAALRELQAQREGLRKEREQVFIASLDRLITEGRIAAADRPAILEAADPTGYTLGLLAPFERIPVGTAVPTQRLAKRRADASPPAIASGGMTADRAGEIARSYRS